MYNNYTVSPNQLTPNIIRESSVQRRNNTLKKPEIYISNFSQRQLQSYNNINNYEQQHDVEYYKSTCVKLEQQIHQLQKDQEYINQNHQNVTSEIEGKAEIILQHNTNLLNENEKFQRQVNQKNAECQLWKQKYESHLNQLVQLKANYELEIKQLGIQIQNLLQKCGEIESAKIQEYEQMNQFIELAHQEKINNFMQTLQEQREMHEQQMLSMTSELQHQQQQLEELNCQLIVERDCKFSLENIIKNFESEINHLQEIVNSKNNQNDQLVQDMQNQKNFYAQQLDEFILSSQSKEGNYQLHITQLEEQIKNIIQDQNLERQEYERKIEQSRSSIEFLNLEIEKLKDTIARKNKDNETTIFQFNQIKKSLEDELKQYKYELESIRNQSYENDKIKSKEMEELKLKNGQLDIQLREKVKQMDLQNEYLSNELKRAKDTLEERVNECEQSFNSKSQLERENRKLKDLNEELKNKCQVIERERQSQIEEIQIKTKVAHEYYIESLNQNFTSRLNSYSQELLEQKSINEKMFGEYENGKQKLNRLIGILKEIKNSEDNKEIQMRLHQLDCEFGLGRIGSLRLGLSPGIDTQIRQQ